ncbi:hypothetical protein DICPUDRAFT_99153 [Dictyostelium purpureum]|uniref:Uncharacterized protein n=1 Tax=Dictyostelium purpureum TaxID=5786 RepID=F0ZWQ2_DICPU|nr:uncharacterized protein DICPUDRAFT_99153 [Dictyostelium purpureum]EGC31617.1 hypothetical protein DICPUDRAFT_99153 [Dictyostelium purpureum]|eukprot:XP_003291845.1 hypothetical protein DICPUDRAFT_99153 [Dictyostelium purpureum]
MAKKKVNTLLYIIGIILYFLGIASIYYYPKNANNTYLSENALMPGTARVTFDYSDGSKITQYSNDFLVHISQYNKRFTDGTVDPFKRSKSCSEWIVSQLKEMGLEAYIHKYNLNQNSYSNHYFNQSLGEEGYNVYAVLRAPKSDGRESIVISASFNSSEDTNIVSSTGQTTTESSVGVALTLFQYLSKKGNIWLAKDLILIISDSYINNIISDSNSFVAGSSAGANNNIGLKSWLHDYHDTSIDSNSNYFPRAGLIQAAINIEANSKKYINDRIYVLAEGSNGQLPNLDLINTIGRLAKREGYSKGIELSATDNNDQLFINHLPSEIRTLGKFMLNQAIGIPTGDHGQFNKYHIDAVTLGVSGKSSTLGSRVLIGTIRSLNNLLEKFHQSFYYYLLPSPYLYVSIGEYMISLGLIIAPLAFRVVYLLVSLSNIFTSPTLFTVNKKKKTDDDGDEKPITDQKPQKKRKNLFEKLGSFKCLDSPKDIIYSVSINTIFQLIGIALFSIPQTFTNTTTNILNYLINNEIIGLFGLFGIFYIIIFLVLIPIIDHMFYKNESIITLSEKRLKQKSLKNSNNNNNSINNNNNSNQLYSIQNHLKTESNSYFVFGNLPLLIFIATVSLLNFSFCTLAAVLSIPLCFISLLGKCSADCNSVVKLFRKTIVFILLLCFSPPVIFYLFSHFVLNQNVFVLLSTIIQQYDQYSNLFFPFLTLVYIPLNLSILKINL